MTHTHTQVADAGAEEVAVAFPSLDHCNERRIGLSSGGGKSRLSVVRGGGVPASQTTAAKLWLSQETDTVTRGNTCVEV